MKDEEEEQGRKGAKGGVGRERPSRHSSEEVWPGLRRPKSAADEIPGLREWACQCPFVLSPCLGAECVMPGLTTGTGVDPWGAVSSSCSFW